MSVLLNKWDGEKFENNICCSRCGRKTAVKVLFNYQQYCKACLLEFVAEIDQAVLAAPVDKAQQLRMYGGIE